MEIQKEYDKRNPSSIETYAQRLVGKTFRQVWEEDEQQSPQCIREEGAYGSTDVDEKKAKQRKSWANY